MQSPNITVSLTPEQVTADTDVSFTLHITSDTEVGWFVVHVPSTLTGTRYAYFKVDLSTLTIPQNWQYHVIEYDPNGYPLDIEFNATDNQYRLTDITISFKARTPSQAGTYTWEVTLENCTNPYADPSCQALGTYDVNTTVIAYIVGGELVVPEWGGARGATALAILGAVVVATVVAAAISIRRP